MLIQIYNLFSGFSSLINYHAKCRMNLIYSFKKVCCMERYSLEKV